MDTLLLDEKVFHYPSPPANCVLYLPGYPPLGDTIHDRSNTFYDSAINTNEELDDSETDVDVTPDATTAIPVGSTIRVESEQMLVSATGTTLTVTRGYNGTTPAAHATSKDIYRLTSNHGTIYGATWTRLPSGLWVLTFGVPTADDHVVVADSPSLSFGNGTVDTGLFIKAWIKMTDATSFVIVSKGNVAASVREYSFGLTDTDKPTFALTDHTAGQTIYTIADSALTADQGSWIMLTATYDGSSSHTGLSLYRNDTLLAETSALAGTYVAMHNEIYDVEIGRQWNDGTVYDKGMIALLVMCNVGCSQVKVTQHYNQERHLFSV